MLFSTGLDASASHTATIHVNAATNREFRFFGGQTTLGVTSGRYALPHESLTEPDQPHSQLVGPPDNVDDQAPGWSYTPGRGASLWDSHVGLTGHFNNSETFSCLYNPSQPQSATLPFSNAGGVVLFGGIRVAHEFYTIEFNGQSYNVDASSQWQEQRLVLFAQGGLDPNAQYTITVSNFNPQHLECVPPPASGFWPCCVTIDEVVLLSPAPADATPTTSGSVCLADEYQALTI